MRAYARLVLVSFAVAAGVSLAGCDTVEWVTDSLQSLADTKRRLPGDRKPVFPEGVPGVAQGVPQEYLPQKAGEEANEAAAKEGEAAPKAANAPTEKKDKPARKPPRPQATEAAKKPAPAEPTQPQAAEPQSPAQAPSSQLPWPAAPPPGNFSR
jgi:hypothetical protein